LRPSPTMDRIDEPSRPWDTRFAANHLACCPAGGRCVTVLRSAAALWAAALGLGLSCPLRRVLARTRKSLMGRHLGSDCLSATSWGFAAQGMVPHDRDLDRRRGN